MNNNMLSKIVKSTKDVVNDYRKYYKTVDDASKKFVKQHPVVSVVGGVIAGLSMIYVQYPEECNRLITDGINNIKDKISNKNKKGQTMCICNGEIFKGMEVLPIEKLNIAHRLVDMLNREASIPCDSSQKDLIKSKYELVSKINKKNADMADICMLASFYAHIDDGIYIESIIKMDYDALADEYYNLLVLVCTMSDIVNSYDFNSKSKIYKNDMKEIYQKLRKRKDLVEHILGR